MEILGAKDCNHRGKVSMFDRTPICAALRALPCMQNFPWSLVDLFFTLLCLKMHFAPSADRNQCQ